MRFAVTVLALLMMAASAVAGPNLSGVNLGSYVTGPKLAADDLEGRVVVFEYWGVNCPPCRASIPHLVKIQQAYSRHKLVVVASHCQGGGAANAAKVWLEHAGYKDVVSVVDGGDLPGAQVNSIPRVFVFDHTGKLVFDGNPHDGKFNVAVKKAAGASPGFLIAGREFEVFAADADRIARMRSSIADTLQRLRVVLADPQAKGHEEAEFLLDSVSHWSDGQYQKIASDPTADALATRDILKQMLSLLQGDELGEKFVELDAKLRADAGFDAEVSAAKLLNQIEEYVRAKGLASGALSARRRAPAERTVRSRIGQLIDRYPKTRAAKKAQALLDKLG